MKMRFVRIPLVFVLAATAAVAVVRSQATSSPACNLYGQAQIALREGRTDNALELLKRVEACEDVNRRAEALLTAGQVHLRSWPRRIAEAKAIGQTLTTNGAYLKSPSGPGGFILLGTIALENRDFQVALDQFRNVNADNFPPSDSFAEALHYTGEVRRLAHQPEAAMRDFVDVTLRYPRTDWAARSLMSAANILLHAGKPLEAMASLQRIRRDSPGREEANIALTRNAIIHRLALRGPRQSAQLIRSLGKNRYRDGVGLAVDKDSRVILGYRDGLAIFSGETLEQVDAPPLVQSEQNVSAIGLGPGSVPTLARKNWLLLGTEPPSQFFPEIPREERTEPAEIQAFVTNWRGDWLVADGKTEAIHVFAGGKYVRPFVRSIDTFRMAQNDVDDVAVLNARTKDVQIYDRDGKPKAKSLPRRGTNPAYEFQTPMDIAFDVLGNLYLLDAGPSAIYVFDPALTLRTTIELPAKGPTGLRKPVALAIDRAGRLFVLDRDGQQVVAFR